jgi:HAD superfamily hydrolase (TIGR01548 family)
MMGVSPELVIFDVDGVLVDVRGSFHQTIIDTVEFFTGKRVNYREIAAWKNKGGYNDDWVLSTAWIKSLGVKVTHDEVMRKGMKFYWGDRGHPGNVMKEKWLLPRQRLAKWSRWAELAIATGRTREELDFTLDRLKVRKYFTRSVTKDDLRRQKPDPEGLLRLLGKLDPKQALYLGDTVDDARASQRACVPFFGVLPEGGTQNSRRARAGLLRDLGAIRVMNSVNDLEKYWI